MIRMKKRPRAEWKKRFARYRVLFALGAGFLLAGVALGAVFAAGRETGVGKSEFLPLFLQVLTRSSLALLGSFLLGITVYAPAWQAISALGAGFLSGFAFTSFARAGEPAAFAVFLSYFLLRSWLHLAYGAFGTLVSLRLFTDRRLSPEEEEGRVFGGTLFNSVLFENTLNLRFLFTYSLFFLSALLLNAAIAAAYAFGFSRI